MKLVFASSNLNKLNEIRSLTSDGYTIVGLPDLNFTEELEETGATLEENALQKARFIARKYGLNCFSDDSGLEVNALKGAPGVHSAYYAGLPRDDAKNMNLLLNNLHGASNRKAVFRTVIAMVWEGKEYLFEGRLEGTICDSPRGTAGFGYDPVFIPDGHMKTLAEGGMELKNSISHRKRAVAALINFLETHKMNR